MGQETRLKDMKQARMDAAYPFAGHNIGCRSFEKGCCED
jgi:hypothetical protein